MKSIRSSTSATPGALHHLKYLEIFKIFGIISATQGSLHHLKYLEIFKIFEIISATQGSLHHLSIAWLLLLPMHQLILPPILSSPQQGLASEILNVFLNTGSGQHCLLCIWQVSFELLYISQKPLRQKSLGVLGVPINLSNRNAAWSRCQRNRGSVICRMICYILSSVWITICITMRIL